MNDDIFSGLKENISMEKKSVKEMKSVFNSMRDASGEEKEMLSSQLKMLMESFKKNNEEIGKSLDLVSLNRPLSKKDTEKPVKKEDKKVNLKFNKKLSEYPELSSIEKETLKRLRKKKKKKIEEKIKKPSMYLKTANKYFSGISRSLIKRKEFEIVGKDLIKTNMEFTPTSYISLILFSTSIAAGIGLVLFLFFLFFNIGVEFPIITRATGSIGIRFLRAFLFLIIAPVGTFLFMYFYPSLEKRSLEYQINQELPFATIHMSAISESFIEPSKIFSILISTKEYPYIEKEFTKLINEINIYGYDLVTAMRSVALKTPSKKLAELLNSLATTINSGGDLPIFFGKRAQTLLFEYRLEREKYTKTAETFMDIYISVVIAAPMILMLILMMMRISGLGISLSGSTITLVMVLGVALINIIFLTFLNLKQPKG